MKPDFAHACLLRLLHLYPRAWRERYADEAAALPGATNSSFAHLPLAWLQSATCAYLIGIQNKQNDNT